MSTELKEPVLKLLTKQYEPDTMIEIKFKRYDLAFKTDDAGRPILLFMGVRDPQGNIKGERYARRLKIDASGNIIKDHWEHKGKAT
jgi:hypothetical protein